MRKRRLIYLAIIVSYFIPLFFSYYFKINETLFWTLAAIFGFALCRIVYFWEKKMQQSARHLLMKKINKMALLENTIPLDVPTMVEVLKKELSKTQESKKQLQIEMANKLEEMRLAYLEFEDLRKEYKSLEEEYALAKKEIDGRLAHKDNLIAEYQKTIFEQRSILESKQKIIFQLEHKVSVLVSELSNFMHHTMPVDRKEIEPVWIDAFLTSSKQVHTPFDSAQLLKKYIETTESWSCVHQEKDDRRSRFLDFSVDCNAVDRRRLFDAFKDELGAIVFIYAPSDQKFLYANQAVKSLTGWSCEKFMREFPRLLAGGYQQWQEAMHSVTDQTNCSLKVSVQKKSGKPKQFVCYMGSISKGPFANSILGILC